ncbi:ribosomal-processing cysteine protease Prp [Kroppenstedtia eburnea]|uniref:ribosomal-processing cysteine protease Prp n=1 Tax=Kroppenstedtia eburnea TaxID=714067 RepID=UPI00097117B0|nr:ribosomal-processing cysteine protease Prp [Kroppenstedtia eburnea]
MIRISLYRDGEGGLERVILRGHAGFGEAGEDLVCAAVSGIAVGLTNASETLLGVQIHGDDVDEEEGGYLECGIPEGLMPETREKVRFLLEAMTAALQSVADAYPAYIQIQER